MTRLGMFGRAAAVVAAVGLACTLARAQAQPSTLAPAPAATLASEKATVSPAVDSTRFAKDVADAYAWGDYPALERLFAQASVPGARAGNGTSLLSRFRYGLSLIEDDERPLREPYTLQLERLTAQWLREHPRSSLSHGLYARALIERAWAARGGGYANTVPREARADFKRLLQQAADHLVKHADVALVDSFNYQSLLAIGLGLDWAAADVWKIAKEGLKKNAQDDSLYFTTMVNFLPKWRGDAVTLDRFIEEATNMTRAERGEELYALLYSEAASQQFEHALFQDSAANWARMRQGFKQRLARYPGDKDRTNRFAYLACLAKDRATYLELAEDVGDKPLLSEWGSNAARVVADCKRWAAES